MIVDAYWPAWLGGIALGGVVVLNLITTHRQLAVSSILTRLFRWSRDEQDRAKEIELAAGSLDAAMIEATRERFGNEAVAALEESNQIATTDTKIACGPSDKVRPPIASGVVFLVALAIGGLLARLHAGGVELTLSVDPELAQFLGGGITAFLALLTGGFMVGFGARMAGGCTSGHGLCGVARLQTGSLATTASLFAAGILVSLALEMLT